MPIYALADERPRIHPGAFVHPEAVLIGQVHVDEGSSIWPGVVIRADNGPIFIGKRTSVQDGSVLHTIPATPTTVGDDCVIGHLVHLEGCLIEDVCLVGSGSTVLEGAICRTVSFVAAGALVRPRMEVPSHAMALGVPATLRPDSVTPDMIMTNVKAYLHHIPQHRDAMHVVDVESCWSEDVGPQR